MQMYCKISLSVIIAILCSTQFTICEESKKLEIENNDSRRPLPLGFSGPYSRLLWAHGDYTKLKLIIRTNKKDYYPDEAISISFHLRNDSDGDVNILGYPLVPFEGRLRWKLFHSNYDAVIDRAIFKETNQRRNQEDYDNTSVGRGGIHITLKPGHECFLGRYPMNEYIDLSKPDTYEWTCFLATAIFGQYFDPPLQSNTLTFRVLEEGEKAEPIEIGINPPKGEEVFKQPKPPKSVFYVYDDDEPHTPRMRTSDGRSIAKPRKIIDISPETYYHERMPVE